jgi:hypothetical protein
MSSPWGKILREIEEKDSSIEQTPNEKFSIPSIFNFFNNSIFIGRFPNCDSKKGFSHDQQFSIPCPYLSQTHFSVHKNKDNSFSIADYSKNGTYLSRQSGEYKTIDLVGDKNTIDLHNGDKILLKFKNEVKLIYKFIANEDLNNNNVVGNKMEVAETSKNSINDGENTLQSQVINLLEVNSKQERKLEEYSSTIESCNNLLTNSTRDLVNSKSIITTRDNTIEELKNSLKEMETKYSLIELSFNDIKYENDNLQNNIKSLKLEIQNKIDQVSFRDEMVRNSNSSLDNEIKEKTKIIEEKDNLKILYTRASKLNLALEDVVEDTELREKNATNNNNNLINILERVKETDIKRDNEIKILEINYHRLLETFQLNFENNLKEVLLKNGETEKLIGDISVYKVNINKDDDIEQTMEDSDTLKTNVGSSSANGRIDTMNIYTVYENITTPDPPSYDDDNEEMNEYNNMMQSTQLNEAMGDSGGDSNIGVNGMNERTNNSNNENTCNADDSKNTSLGDANPINQTVDDKIIDEFETQDNRTIFNTDNSSNVMDILPPSIVDKVVDLSNKTIAEQDVNNEDTYYPNDDEVEVLSNIQQNENGIDKNLTEEYNETTSTTPIKRVISKDIIDNQDANIQINSSSNDITESNISPSAGFKRRKSNNSNNDDKFSYC